MQQKQMEAGDQPLIYVEPKKRRAFFVILYLLFIFDFISRIGINSIFPVIQSDLGLSDTQVGMMGSVVLVGMAVLVLPVSFLGEKYSPKKAISLSALVWSIGTLLSGIASNFSLLLSSRFFGWCWEFRVCTIVQFDAYQHVQQKRMGKNYWAL